MKKQRLFSRILLPTVLALLLLPPLSCLVFQRAANRYAYIHATESLETLQRNVLPLMSRSFDATSGGNPSEQVRAFLRGVGPLVRKTGGGAKLLILESRLRVIYPYEEQEREEVADLAQTCAQYIQSSSDASALHNSVIRLKSGGEEYLVHLYRAPTKSSQIQFLIAYCSVSQMSVWVRDAAKIVLAIAAFFDLLIVGLLWVVARSITRPLNRLCAGAEQIGRGGFLEIAPSFSLNELERLRLAMNEMAQRLRRADEAQRDFFQNVSHELRNPLMSISGYAQGIERGVFPVPKDAAHTILEESGRLAELVGSLLTLSRIEGGQSDPSLGLFPLAEPLEDCLDRVNGIALQCGIALSLAPFDATLCAYGEEELFNQVLENLLSNAIRYARSQVTVRVSVDEAHVELCVADDGDGISLEDASHLFERCYKGKDGHFGIGLAIARSAAEKMHGTLRAENQASGGALFMLTLGRHAPSQRLHP